jgi:hypothetical protein
MKNYLIALCLATAALPMTAQAETGNFAGAYVGGAVGYFLTGVKPISFGGFGGYNFQVGDKLTVGPEAGIGAATKSVGFEFHINGNVGYQVSDGAEVFGGVGYQKFKSDRGALMLQTGANFKVGENLRLRPLVRTLEFDTFEFQIGVAFGF